jgi:hypothetical protein
MNDRERPGRLLSSYDPSVVTEPLALLRAKHVLDDLVGAQLTGFEHVRVHVFDPFCSFRLALCRPGTSHGVVIVECFALPHERRLQLVRHDVRGS